VEKEYPVMFLGSEPHDICVISLDVGKIKNLKERENELKIFVCMDRNWMCSNEWLNVKEFNKRVN